MIGRGRLRRPAVALLCAPIVIALAAKLGATRVDHDAHRERLLTLQRARAHERARVQEVLQIRSGGRFDFDALIAHRRAIESCYERLRGLAERDGELAGLVALAEASAAVTRDVDDFKTQAAIARNSAIYVSRLADELGSDESDARGPVAAPLGRLQLELMRYEQTATPEQQRRVEARARELAAVEATGATRQASALMATHVALWMRHERGASAELEAIVSAELDALLATLERRAGARYEAALGDAQRARGLVVIAVLGLIAILTLARVGRRRDARA